MGELEKSFNKIEEKLGQTQFGRDFLMFGEKHIKEKTAKADLYKKCNEMLALLKEPVNAFDTCLADILAMHKLKQSRK